MTAEIVDRGTVGTVRISADFDDGQPRVKLKDLTALLGWEVYEACGRLFKNSNGSTLAKQRGSAALWLTREQFVELMTDAFDVAGADKLALSRNDEQPRRLKAAEAAVLAWFDAAARSAELQAKFEAMATSA